MPTVQTVAGGAPEAYDWLGDSVWQAPGLEISRIKFSPKITAMGYRRGGGESIWRGDRHRLVLAPNPLAWVDVQVDHGRTRQWSPISPGGLSFNPAGQTIRIVHPAAQLVQVLWDTDLYAALLPELGTAVSEFEYLGGLEDPLLGPIVASLAEEIDGGFADDILTESLGTVLCIRIARQFVGRLPLPASNGLSPDRLQRVRDYIEAHLDNDLSLTILADIACLSPYHFSRSFKRSVGVGPQRYVIQRRLERVKLLLRRTDQPLALVARRAGFSNPSRLITAFRREIGATPTGFRAASD